MQATTVCTTQQAAELLGISVTSVQQLVEAGVIEAWKTKGGHRRIPLAAVHAYKRGVLCQTRQLRRIARLPAPAARPMHGTPPAPEIRPAMQPCRHIDPALLLRAACQDLALFRARCQTYLDTAPAMAAQLAQGKCYIFIN